MQYGRAVFLISVFLAGAGTWLWRLCFDFIFGSTIMRQKTVLIVGAGHAGKLLYETMKDQADYRVLGLMSEGDPSKWNTESLPRVLGGPGMLRDIIKSRGVNIVVLAISHFHDSGLLKAALECKLDGVAVYDMPSFYEKITGKVPVDHVTDLWLVFTPLLGVKKTVYNQRVKRVLDVLLSLAGLVIFLPISLFAAIAIKLDSRGPVLFKQARVGLNDEIFTLLKFRSMKTGTDSDRSFAGDVDDPRITCVGKLIRKFRIDELPQMWNVLRGDMSFIGPRALMVDEFRKFESRIHYFLLRHSVRPASRAGRR
jgi:hypothetical protein